jgi:hypothetical protein
MPSSDASHARRRPAAAARGRAAFVAVALLGSACVGDDAPVPPRVLVDTGAHRDRAATWTEAQVNGEATVRVLYVPADGFAYRDTTNQPTGVTVEIMRDFARHVANRHGVELTLDFVEEPDWSVFYQRVRDGSAGVFGLGNVTITEARRAELQFSPPYMTNVAVLITHAIVPELESLDDIPTSFQGLQPLAFTGTLHEQRLAALRDEYMPDAELVPATSNAEIIERCASAPDYFAYVDIYNYWRAIDAGEPLRRHPPGDQAGEEFGIVMPLDSDWAELVEEYFAAGGGLRQRTFYRDLLVRHLGPGLADQLRAAER